MKLKQILLMILTAALLFACGGGSSSGGTTSSSGTTGGGSSSTSTGLLSATGSATFSGSGAVDVPTGTSFTATNAHVSDVTTPITQYILTIYGSEATAPDQLTIAYAEAQSAFGMTYSVTLNYITATSVMSWRADSIGSQVLGVTFNKTTKSLQLTNVVALRVLSSGTMSSVTINGSFNY